ncbi:hypothetical protein [Devosia sp. 1635]|uniref:hypothetical protein n=1 Tax=Devosia sp. 1635 TaxID=2726066 RepID=UPI0015670A68|nr:hypothetical protein [Devosia sp. 1635]
MTIDYEAFANGFLIVVTGLLTYMGVRKGVKAPEPEPEPPAQSFALKMAMIDNRAVEALAASVETLNATVMENNKLISKDIHDREIREEVARQIKDRQ